jgi:hypothetical protein
MSDQHDPADEPIYTLDNPPPPRPSPEALAEAQWRRIRARPDFSEARHGHRRPRFLERSPVRLFGIAVAGFGRVWFLYRTAQGERRVLGAEEHDQAGIAALFAGAEGWLCRLWPASDGGWDPERAAETLLYFNGWIGTVDAAALGFELPADEPLP